MKLSKQEHRLILSTLDDTIGFLSDFLDFVDDDKEDFVSELLKNLRIIEDKFTL